MWKLLRPDAATVLEDPLAKKSLSRYFDVMQNNKIAKFKISKSLPAKFANSSSTEELWQEHAKLTEQFSRIERQTDHSKKVEATDIPEKSYFDLKLELSRRIIRDCNFCNRKCRVDRAAGKLGYCRCGNTLMVSSMFMHVGEEPELVPSGTIFTMGCTIRCFHCQNWVISQWVEKGSNYTPEAMAVEVEHLRVEGCRNVNLVGGEPTPWLNHWLQTFKYVETNVPVVWNSNSYYSTHTAQLLVGFADVYLLDFKYGSDVCARRISDAPNYWEVCTANHLKAKAYGELIIRVLVLPNHLDCCTEPILNWIAKHLGVETRVNLMFQYRPEWQAHRLPDLRRTLTTKERNRALELAKNAGLCNIIT
ncbi:MAG: radical SAM protein [Candidatus Bathyarchaeota archaeon]|nr:radical SAM protein [Candidatus Bathyarchaeota archaeon]